jgi:hypothetical protein
LPTKINTMKKPVLVALWIVATLATTAVAYVAVNAAGAEVTDRPLTSVVATGDSAATSSTSTTGQPGTSTITTGGGSSTTGGTGTTSGTGATGTTSGSTTSTSSSSTSSTATTGTTLSDAPWQQTTIPSKGGLVVVSYRPGEVKLESVAPTPGFSYEIDDQGPPDVRVQFESGDVKVEVRVRWDGGLVTEIDEDN